MSGATIVLADHSAPTGTGLRLALQHGGFQVTGEAADADELLRLPALEDGDVVDVRRLHARLRAASPPSASHDVEPLLLQQRPQPCAEEVVVVDEQDAHGGIVVAHREAVRSKH